jgi:hypothetical protein
MLGFMIEHPRQILPVPLLYFGFCPPHTNLEVLVLQLYEILNLKMKSPYFMQSSEEKDHDAEFVSTCFLSSSAWELGLSREQQDRIMQDLNNDDNLQDGVDNYDDYHRRDEMAWKSITDVQNYRFVTASEAFKSDYYIERLR